MPQFGDPTPAPPRTCEATLRQINELCNAVDPWDLAAFQKAAKALKLLGVHKPFWQDWKFAELFLFLMGKILHSGHKFFFNHPLDWCKIVAGSHTLDTHFMNLHRHVSYHHFTSGVSKSLQMTGCSHHDLERTIVPVLDGAGGATDEFILAIRAMVKFIYHAQDPVHTDSSIATMKDALAEFHAGKESIITLGAQKGMKAPMNHFRIPKLEVMQSFGHQTKANGALIQYTADVMEHLLIIHCKTTFQCTSRQAHTFVDQIMDILNHEESLRLFDLYIILRLSEHSALDTVVNTEHKAVTTIDSTLEFIQHVRPNKKSTFHGLRPFCNHFEDPNSIVSA